MKIYSFDEINPKYHEKIKQGLKELGLEDKPVTDYELMFVAPMEMLSEDFLIK